MRDKYYRWLTGLIRNGRGYSKKDYSELLTYLNEKPYHWTKDMDSNRAEDGISLRWKFAYRHGISYGLVERYITGPCTVLEMMVALMLRSETHITGKLKNGGIFWVMIRSLGLDIFDNKLFDQEEIDRILDRWMDNKIGKNGTGGLFTIENKNVDMRQEEIWKQMNWYFSELNLWPEN